jgi:hypothetical protein
MLFLLKKFNYQHREKLKKLFNKSAIFSMYFIYNISNYIPYRPWFPNIINIRQINSEIVMDFIVTLG